MHKLKAMILKCSPCEVMLPNHLRLVCAYTLPQIVCHASADPCCYFQCCGWVRERVPCTCCDSLCCEHRWDRGHHICSSSPTVGWCSWSCLPVPMLSFRHLNELSSCAKCAIAHTSNHVKSLLIGKAWAFLCTDARVQSTIVCASYAMWIIHPYSGAYS